MDYSLVFRKSDENVQLQGYCDADWASSYTERKSISANVYQHNGNRRLISWKNKKQNVVALSSCQVEYTCYINMCARSVIS